MAKKKPKIIGYIDASGNFNEGTTMPSIEKQNKSIKSTPISSNKNIIEPIKDSRTIKTNQKNNTDIRTIKTESPKKQGIIGQIGQVGESGLSSAFSGLTSIADVPFQEAQEQAQKGKKIKQDDLVKEGIKGIARALSPAYNMIEGNKEVTKKVKNLFKDKKKTTTQKIVGTGLAALNNEGLDNTYQGVKNAFKIWGAVNPNLDKQIANVQSKIDAPAQKWQEKVQEENAQLDKPFQIASDVSGVIGNMAPAALGTYLTKDPNVGRVILAASAKGQSTKDALQRGADIETANDIGVAKGLTEVGTEMATGGLNFLGKGALDDVAKGFIDKKVGKPMLNFIGKKMLGIAGENAEEVASDLIGNLIDRGTIDPNAKYTKEDLLNTLLMTTLSTGAMNTLSGGYGRNAYRQNIEEMQESRGINGNNLNTINNNVPSSQQVREVNEIQQRAQNGEISYEQANQQLAQVQDGTYQQNQLIESMASQEVERIQQAVETGQMSPAEASQEIQAINNTLTSERERINQPVQEVKEANIEETTQEKPVEKTSNEQETTQEPIKVEARETKSSENKAEKVETSKTEDKEQKKISPLDILTKDERQQYDRINEKRVNGQPLSQEDKNTLNSFQKKWNNYKEEQQRKAKNAQENKSNIKYEDLSKDYNATRYDKKMYAKAKNTKMDMSNYDKVMEFIIPNKKGNYSKQQILTLAEELGKKSKAKTGNELKQEAINYWVNKEPFNKTDSKTKYLKIEEFLKSYYKGAGVGTKLESQQEVPKVQEKLQAKEQPKVETQKENIAEKVEEPVIKVKEKLPERNNKFEEIKFEQNEKIEPKKVEVLGSIPSKKKQSINEKVKSYTKEAKEAGSFLRRKFVDKMQSVDMLDRANNRKDNLYAEADRTHRSVAEAQYSIGDGQINSEGKEYNNFTNKDGSKGNKSLLGIFDEVEENGMDMQEFNEYLIDYLNLDRYDKVTEDGKTKAPRGLDHTKKMSEENIKKFEEKHKEAKRIAENIWQYGYNELDTKVQDGLMTKQQAQNFKKETPHYVPISRDVEGYQSSLQKIDNKLSVNNQIKKIKGDSRETILPIRETMAWNTVLSRSSQRINNAIKAIAPYYDAANTDLSYSDSDLNINQDNVAVKSKDGKYYLTYYENGQAKTMQVEKGMYEAFLPEQVYEWEKIFKIPAGIDSLRKKLITDYNIKFLKNNAIKDLQDAMINTQYPKEFLLKYGDVATRLKNKDADSKMQQYINEFKKAGGFSETYFADREFTSQETKNPVKKSLQALNKANEYIELTPRLTEYILSRENGESVSVALHNAADVTVNFARGGSWAKKMNKIGFTFFNPSIQGADKAVRNLDPRNPRRFASTVIRGALLGISAGVLNEMLWDSGDDDDKKEYDNLNEYIKNNYYILPDKNGKPSVRIPKGRVLSVLQSIGRRGYNTYKGEGSIGENFKDLPSYAWGQVGPADPGNNNVFAPLFQAWSNKSWSGNPIDSNYEVNNTAPEERYSVKTTEMAKKLGKALGISPKRIDYVFDQYSGSIGDLIIPMTNQYAETSSDNKIIEGLGAVFGNDMKVDPVFSNKQLGKMYDNSNKYNNLPTKEKEKMKNKVGNQYLNEKIGEVSELNKQIKEIQGSNKSNKEKQKETRKLQKQINDIAESANDTYKKVKKQGDYAATVGDNVYAKNDYGQWKKESEQTKAKRDSLGLNVEDYYYLKKEEAYTQPNGRKQSLVDGETAKEKIALVDAFGFDPSDYLEYSYNINNIKEGKNTKQKVFEYINSLDISQEQKIALMKKKYKTYRSYDNQLYNTINNADLTKEEKESVANFLKIGG